ncbi:hypothetical protein Dda_0076 [Drechslerella dactyloides]|uniref:F-box domain-containing protein n=1 Tax=Drechslerella dactyloides TaxID=74499 RepID=A0AAD6J3P6_DREDA|nr:hypothetical protein Dda_0076 [Drechslerella dactyloides]
MSSVGLLQVPPEVLEAIFQYVPKKDLKNFALSGSIALHIVSPILYRRLSLRLDAVPHDCTNSRRYPCCEEHCLDVEAVDSVLNSSARALNYVREFVIAPPERTPRAMRQDAYIPPPASMSHLPRQRNTLNDRDDFLLRLVLQKLGNADLENFQSISIPNCDISTKCFALILKSQPNLRTLKLGRVGIQKQQDRGEIAELESAQGALNLECLEFGEFKEELVLPILQTLRRCAGSLRELNIGSSCMSPTRASHTGARFSPGSREIQSRKRSDPKISLPSLERLEISFDTHFPGFLDLFGHLVENCHRLTRLRLNSCDYSHNFILDLIDRGGASIRSFQTNSCFWPAGSMRIFFHKLQPLHTLKLNSHGNIFISDIEPVFEHRDSLKRLWLGCGFLGLRLEEGDCLCMQTFWDPDTCQYPLNSENWPLLEELAMPNVQWENIPLIHNLRVLRLLPSTYDQPRHRNDHETGVTRFVKKLWEHSMSHYKQRPKLEAVIVGVGSRSERYVEVDVQNPAYYIIRYDGAGDHERPKLRRYTDLSKILALKLCAWSYLFEARIPDGFWEDARQSSIRFDNDDEINTGRDTLPGRGIYDSPPLPMPRYRTVRRDSDIEIESDLDILEF